MTLSRTQRDTIDTAWHEAGHVVGAWAAGVRVSSVWCTGQRSRVGRVAGRTQIEVMDLLDHRPSDAALHIQSLAGDAAFFNGEHVLAVSDAVGKAGFDELWAAANALVEERSTTIEAVATALLASPDLALYPRRDVLLAAGNETAAPGRDAADRRQLAAAIEKFEATRSG